MLKRNRQGPETLPHLVIPARHALAPHTLRRANITASRATMTSARYG